MHRKWTTARPQQTTPQLVITNEQFEDRPVLKTIFKQLEKTSPDRRSAKDRIAEKSKSLAERLTK